MLMWSLRLTVCSIALLALIADIYGFLRFAPTIGLPRWAAVVCVMPIKAVEWSFLIFAHRLWASNWLESPIPIPRLFMVRAFALSSVECIR